MNLNQLRKIAIFQMISKKMLRKMWDLQFHIGENMSIEGNEMRNPITQNKAT